MNIEELCQKSHQTAVVKGWHEDERSLGEALCLMHSEISEALECHRDPTKPPCWVNEDDGKPEGIIIELADLLIRIGDTCQDMQIPLATALSNTEISMLGYGMEPKEKPISIPLQFTLIHVALSTCYVQTTLAEKKNSRGEGQEIVRAASAMELATAMSLTGAICRAEGWDLDAAVRLKMAFNDTRPYRHGGKRA